MRSWALGRSSRQLQRCWGFPMLTQQYTDFQRRLKPVRQLHSTCAVKRHHEPLHGHQQQVLCRQQLDWQELHRAAQIAAWSGLCYLMPDELQDTISRQHQGLTLVASGRNGYTAWFIVDGVVPAAHFCSTISQRSSSNGSSNGSNGSSNGNNKSPSGNGNGSSHDQPHNHGVVNIATGGADKSGSTQASTFSSNGNSSGSSGPDDDPAGVCGFVPSGRRERFVFFRGVQWSAPDINTTQLSQALMNLWPSQFPHSTSSSTGSGACAQGDAGSPLVAHAGVAGIAQGLFSQLRPYMQQADDVGMPLCFAGHSLGGSLAMLLLVLHQMHRKHSQQHPLPVCYTFGSPPVLAHAREGGGAPVLRALGLPPDAVKSFVLEMDPVPRALLSVDPTFQLFSGWSAVKGLLQLREWLLGPGSPLSPGRFLFEPVGQVHFIKWTAEGGAQVVPLDAAELEQELSLLDLKPPGSTNGLGSTTSSTVQLPSMTAAARQGGTTAAGAQGLQQQPSQQVVGQLEDQAAQAASTAGTAAAALMNSLRAWLDHHHRSYAQELEAAALRGVRQQFAKEQQQRVRHQHNGHGSTPVN